MLWTLLALTLFPAALQQPVEEDKSNQAPVLVPSPLQSQHKVLRLTAQASPGMPMGLGLMAMEQELMALFKQLRPALVEVEFRFRADEGGVRSLLSSGMVLDNYGLLAVPVMLDPEQVVRLESGVRVYRTDGQPFQADILESNAEYGISLLRAPQLRGLAPTFGQGLWVQEGSLTIGLGHPFGLPNAMSFGFVTGSQRGLGTAHNLIQITNLINRGDAGGLVANRKGEVIGMMLTSLSEAARKAQEDLELRVAEYGTDAIEGATQAQGISFAVPIEQIHSLFPDYFPQADGYGRRIGVLVEERIRVLEQDGCEPGHCWEVQVTGLLPQGPAARSGIQAGDVLLSIGGQPTSSLADLGAAIHKAPLATMVMVRRKGKILALPLEFELP